MSHSNNDERLMGRLAEVEYLAMSGCQVGIWDSLALLHKRKIVRLCALSFDDTNIPLFSYTMEYLFERMRFLPFCGHAFFQEKKRKKPLGPFISRLNSKEETEVHRNCSKY